MPTDKYLRLQNKKQNVNFLDVKWKDSTQIREGEKIQNEIKSL